MTQRVQAKDSPPEDTATAPRRGPGRPAHVRDPGIARRVEVMIGLGIGSVLVAQLEGMNYRTLCRHYSDEIATGVAKANLQVAQSLFALATKGRDSKAAIFWLRSRAGWYCAPQPQEPADESAGKKESARISARNCHLGTDWETLLQ